MKKFSILMLVFLLVNAFSSCVSSNNGYDANVQQSKEVEYLEATRQFYEKVVENSALIDEVASDICSMWRDRAYKDTTKEINDSIAKIMEDHKDNIEKIMNLDAEIAKLLSEAKSSSNAGAYVERVMLNYIKYRDSVMNADAAFQDFGYVDISSNKQSLDNALNNLYIKCS